MIQIGFVRKTHGVNGEIRVDIEPDYLEDYLQAEVLFIGPEGRVMPYFIEDIRSADGTIVQLEDLTSREQAQALTGKPIFLRPEDILAEEDRQWEAEKGQYAHLVGYLAKDVEWGELGMVMRIEVMPFQEMAVLDYQGTEALVPLTPGLIQEIDSQAKTITFNLPEGILDL